MDNQTSLFTKKNIINFLFLSILVLGLPVGTELIKSQKILKSQAAAESIRFITDGVNVVDKGSKQVAISTTVTLEITSKDGLPHSQANTGVQLAEINYSPITKAYAYEACGVSPDDEQCYCDKQAVDFCNCEGNCAQTQPEPVPQPQGAEPTSSCDASKLEYLNYSSCDGQGENAIECAVYKNECGSFPIFKDCNPARPGVCGIPEVNVSLPAASQESTQADKDAECRDKPPEYYCDDATDFGDGNPRCIEKQLGWDGVAADCMGVKYTEVEAIAFCPDTPCDIETEKIERPRLLSQAETAATKKSEQAGQVVKVQPGGTVSPTISPVTEKCYVCDNNKWRLNGGTGSCLANITRTCQAGKDVNQVCKSAQDLKDVNCISTKPYTVSFRVSENPVDFDKEIPYTFEPMRVSYTFKDQKPGKKYIYVEFNLSDGKRVSAAPVSINLAQSDAQVASLSCSLDPAGQGIKITFKGDNFGPREGRINVDNSIPLRILSWSDNQVVALGDDTSIRSKQDLLQATLTRNDGEKITEKCGVGISLISLGAKLFCRSPSQHSQDNVEVIIQQTTSGVNIPGAKKIKEIAKIDKEGVLLGLKTKLEEDKFYSVSIKAPKSLRRIITFTALNGTITLPQTILPVGDIYPRDGGDGRINSLDASELRRQWGKVSTASKNCDFNQDGICNSFEWACMRYDFNKEDDTAI